MLNCSASLAMSTCVLKTLPGKLDIKRYSPSILYIYPDEVPHNFKVEEIQSNLKMLYVIIFLMDDYPDVI